MEPHPTRDEMYSSELRARLSDLHAECREAHAAGLAECDVYMRDLTSEIAECRAAFVGASVTEIAVARAERSGRLVG
jgi:hypothetical protein